MQFAGCQLRGVSCLPRVGSSKLSLDHAKAFGTYSRGLGRPMNHEAFESDGVQTRHRLPESDGLGTPSIVQTIAVRPSFNSFR